MASEIILIAIAAEEACATAVNDPSNVDARADLFKRGGSIRRRSRPEGRG
jgi:hypothetical protein